MPYRIVKVRRRMENKTDYGARINLLKSGIDRLIIRKTNRHIMMQVAKSKEAQDTVIVAATSKELLKYGLSLKEGSSLKSISAAYLTGYLIGTKMKKLKITSAIADLGLARSTKGSRLYAALKGVVDAGIAISCDEKMFPSKERLNGKDMKNKIDIEAIKSKIK
ncbi:MAG: 50S ribosomal protein L18 [archaeon]